MIPLVPAGLLAFGLATALAVGLGLRTSSNFDAAQPLPSKRKLISAPPSVTPIDTSDVAALARARARLDLNEPEGTRLVA